MTLVLVVGIVGVLLWLLGEPAIPLPRHKRAFNHLYNFTGWVPSARNSRKKAEKFKALKTRIDAETDYVNAARNHARARGHWNSNTKKKGRYYGKNH